MQIKENHNSSNYYFGTLLISLIGAVSFTFLTTHVSEYGLMIAFFALGAFIGCIGINFFIATIICSIKYVFTKKWKRFPKILFYTNLVFVVLLMLGSISNKH